MKEATGLELPGGLPGQLGNGPFNPGVRRPSAGAGSRYPIINRDTQNATEYML